MDELETNMISSRCPSNSEFFGSAMPTPNTKEKPWLRPLVEEKKWARNDHAVQSRMFLKKFKLQSEVDDFESRIYALVNKLTSIVNDVAGMVPIVRKLKATYDQNHSGLPQATPRA